MAHPDPGAEQADHACDQHQHLMGGENDDGLVWHQVSFPGVPPYHMKPPSGLLQSADASEGLVLCELALKIYERGRGWGGFPSGRRPMDERFNGLLTLTSRGVAA